MRNTLSFLAILALAGHCILAPAQATRPATPQERDQVEARLEAVNGQTHFSLGEPIKLQLVLRAHTSGFAVNSMANAGQQINVQPSTGWFRAHGVDHFDVVELSALDDKPLRLPALVNPNIVFRQAGRYALTATIYVRAGHLGHAHSFQLTTPPLTLELSAADDTAEAAHVEALVQQINSPGKSKEIAAAAQRLAFLGGDAAVRAKVDFIVAGTCRCNDVKQKMMAGLASSRNLSLQLQLLHAAWLDVNATPDWALYEAMHNTRAYLRGETISGWQPVLRPKTDLAAKLAAAEDARDLDELIASLPARTGRNRADTAYELMSFADTTAEQAAQVRPYVLQDFAKMRRMQQSMLMSGRRWRDIADPTLVPALQSILEAPPAKDIGYGEALGRLIELAPGTAKPYVIREICNSQSIVPTDQLAGLPDEALPEVDACLTQELREWQGTPWLQQDRAQMAARYGSAAMLPAVRSLYAARGQVKADFASYYRGALLAYLLRYAPDEAIAELRAFDPQATGVRYDLSTLFYPIEKAFQARHAEGPPAMIAWLKELSAAGPSTQKAWASYQLTELGERPAEHR